MIEKVAGVLRRHHAVYGNAIDMIFSSDILRTKQTAEIVSKTLKLEVNFDTRLREVDFGKANGSPAGKFYADLKDKQNKKVGRESYGSVAKRVYEFLRDVDKKYHGKNILIVSHQCPLWALENKVKRISLNQAIKNAEKRRRIGRGEIRDLT